MHGSRYGSNPPLDPTNPSFIAAAQGRPDFGWGAAIGRTEGEARPSQPYPPLPENVNQQLLLRSPQNGALPKARPGGLIGELPVGGGAPYRSGSLQGYDPNSMVGRLRLGYGDSGSGPPVGQMPVYRSQSYSQVGQLGQMGQTGNKPLQPRNSMSAIGSSSGNTYPPSAYGPKPPQEPSIGKSNYPPSHGGPPIGGGAPIGGTAPIGGYGGQTGGSIGGAPYPGQNPTPLVGRMASVPASVFPPAPGTAVSGVSGHAGSYASQQFSSPFVPASTTQPIIGGAASQYSLPGQATGSGNISYSTSGGMSQIGSISNLGSISQMGSVGVPSLQASQNLSGNAAKNRSAGSSLTTRVKAVCSSGGHFVKLSGGGCEYQGGETRLIQVPNFCRFSELLDALERITSSAAASSSAGSETPSPSLKYQLPTDMNVYVDLLDDVDTQLMFDEWHEYSHAPTRKPNSKLHLFVDWQRQPQEEGRQVHKQVSLSPHGSAESILGGQDNSADRPTGVSAESANKQSMESSEKNSAGSLDKQSGRTEEGTPQSVGAPQGFDYSQIAEEHRISPRDLTLVKFVGSGGYGEVYLGKWHSSEAAIKCLNPSLFFNSGQVSQAAVMELTKEAKLLGSLRHPNVVWFFGIVVPTVTSGSSDSDGSEGSDEIARVAPSAAAQQGGRGGVPAEVRPPAIVTEYMREGSLKGALQRKAEIVQGSMMRLLIAMDAAKGMEYLHQKKIVHFDLKSANLLLGYRDKRAICKVADFGLSKHKHDTYVTNVTSQRGTLPWTAPEIIKNPKMVTEKVDVFSFGVVLWELWTGKEPYDGLNYHALLHQLTSSDASLRPCLPGSPDWDPAVGPEPVAGYRNLMERCWSESPAGRPSFPQIVKCLKDMAATLRPRKPRPAGRSRTNSAPPPPNDVDPAKEAPVVPEPSISAQIPPQQSAPPPPAGPFGAQSQPATPTPPPAPGGPFGQPQQQSQPNTPGGPFAAMAGPFGGHANVPLGEKISEPPEEPVDRDGKALSIGSAIDVASEGRVTMSPRTVANSEDSLGSKDVGGEEPSPRPSKPVVSAFGAVASQPKPDQ